MSSIRSTRSQFLAGLCLLGVATGCTPHAEIKSNRAADYVGQPTKLVIISGVKGDFSTDVNGAFEAALTESAKRCGAETRMLRQPPIFGNGPITVTMPSFSPDAALTITHGSGISVGYGDAEGLRIYDLQLTDSASKRVVWRANVTFWLGTPASATKPRAETLAIEMIGRMKADNIFLSCAPLGPPA